MEDPIRHYKACGLEPRVHTVFPSTRCHTKPSKMLSASSRITPNNMGCSCQEGFLGIVAPTSSSYHRLNPNVPSGRRIGVRCWRQAVPGLPTRPLLGSGKCFSHRPLRNWRKERVLSMMLIFCFLLRRSPHPSKSKKTDVEGIIFISTSRIVF